MFSLVIHTSVSPICVSMHHSCVMPMEARARNQMLGTRVTDGCGQLCEGCQSNQKRLRVGVAKEHSGGALKDKSGQCLEGSLCSPTFEVSFILFLLSLCWFPTLVKSQCT